MTQMQTQVPDESGGAGQQMGALQQSDAEAARVAIAPRVALADIEAAIAFRSDTRASHIVSGPDGSLPGVCAPLELLSICLLVMRNGFTVVGKSAPASAENFNAELGRKFAYEDAIRQLWPLMGFALRDRLHLNAIAGAGAIVGLPAASVVEEPAPATSCVVAKFKVSQIETFEGGRNVGFDAVYSDDPNSPNHSWSKWTPSGTIKMSITNPAAFEQFGLGDEFFVNFTRA